LSDPFFEALTGVIFAVTYGAVIFRNVGRSSMPIWLIIIGGAVAMVATGCLGVTQAYSAINMPVIAFLFSMFVLVAALDIAGVLDRFANGLLRRAKKPADVLLLVFLGFAFAAAVLMNDTLALMGTPIVISVAKKMRTNPKPLLLTLAFAITIGSASTPMGNPQNLLVALASGVSAPVFTFARYLLIPTLLELLCGYLLLHRLYGRRLSASALDGAKAQLEDDPIRDPKLARVAIACTVLTFALIILVNLLQALGHPQPFGIGEVSFFGAALLLIASGRARDIISSIDWGILLMFAGLFIMMEALSSNGVIAVISGYLPALSTASPTAAIASIILAGVLLSQVVSNVPMVALYLPIMLSLGFGPGDGYAWTALAGGSTLAGNLTILGAASNLIIIEQAEKQGEGLSFTEFLRVGIPMTILTVGILYLSLLAGL
jgi:Na+/H+ antiporter NhaD/arsenite permease-like protein